MEVLERRLERCRERAEVEDRMDTLRTGEGANPRQLTRRLYD